MSTVGRSPQIGVFAVDDRSAQLTWRHLRPGPLHLRLESVDAVSPSGVYLSGGDTDPHHHDLVAPVPWRETGAGRFVLDDGAASSPGSVLIAGLPAGRLLTVRASGPAVRGERDLALRTLDALPGSELCRIATLSDLHLGTEVFGQRGTIREHPKPEIPHPQRCTAAAIEEAVHWGAERIVVKGDLTNAGTPKQWREYARLVGESPVPVDALPGNHDHAHPKGWTTIAPPEAAASFHLSIANPILVRDHPGLRVVLVDTTRAGRHGGSVAGVESDVADAVAGAGRDGGVIVALHHQLQPHLMAEGWPAGIPRDESMRFLESLGAAHRHVLVTSGHTHRHRRWGHAGVAVTQVGSTKDYPGVWAGYAVSEGGMRQIVRRVGRTDCLVWTDHSRRAAAGLWRHIAPGRLDARCFNLPWTVPVS
ncbi:MAG: Calcineurin-like phosphoesterase [Acidimicrobiales bacterium]|nr:Calcineurin-like phosphoesterase [Acidimicrobiales bacterium]